MKIKFSLTDDEARLLEHLYAMLDVNSAKELIFKIPELLNTIASERGGKTAKKLAEIQAKWHAIHAADETAQLLDPRE